MKKLIKIKPIDPDSVQFSHSVVSDSLWPHELQHARPPCPSPTPGVHWDSCPSSQWCHPAISSSVIPFSSCPQPLPASGSFPMSQLFAWGGQSTGISALASVLPKNTQDWSPLGWTGWISLQSKGLSRVFSNELYYLKNQCFGQNHEALLEKKGRRNVLQSQWMISHWKKKKKKHEDPHYPENIIILYYQSRKQINIEEVFSSHALGIWNFLLLMFMRNGSTYPK